MWIGRRRFGGDLGVWSALEARRGKCHCTKVLQDIAIEHVYGIGQIPEFSSPIPRFREGSKNAKALLIHIYATFSHLRDFSSPDAPGSVEAAVPTRQAKLTETLRAPASWGSWARRKASPMSLTSNTWLSSGDTSMPPEAISCSAWRNDMAPGSSCAP